jgi:hypothetical protein
LHLKFASTIIKIKLILFLYFDKIFFSKELEMLCHSHGIQPLNQYNNTNINNSGFSNNYPHMNSKYEQPQQQQQQNHNNLEQSAQINSTTSPVHINNNNNNQITNFNTNSIMLNDMNFGNKNPNSFQNNKTYANTVPNGGTAHLINSNNVNVTQLIGEAISTNLNSLDSAEIFKENMKMFNDSDNETKLHHDMSLISAFNSSSSTSSPSSSSSTSNANISNKNHPKTVKECITSMNGEPSSPLLLLNPTASTVSKRGKYIRKRDLIDASSSVIGTTPPCKRGRKEANTKQPPPPLLLPQLPATSQDKDTTDSVNLLKEEPISPKIANLLNADAESDQNNQEESIVTFNSYESSTLSSSEANVQQKNNLTTKTKALDESSTSTEHHTANELANNNEITTTNSITETPITVTNDNNKNNSENVVVESLSQNDKKLVNENLTLNNINTGNLIKLQNSSKFVITKITTNRLTNPLVVNTNKLNFNSVNNNNNSNVDNSAASSSLPPAPASVTTTLSPPPTPMIKLMTSHSKDPTLASSSLSLAPAQILNTSSSSTNTNSSSS